jgi:hypothetical protein
MPGNDIIIAPNQSAPAARTGRSLAAQVSGWLTERQARQGCTISYRERFDRAAQEYVMEQRGTQIRSLQFPRITWEPAFEGPMTPRIEVTYASLQFRPGRLFNGQWERGEWEFHPDHTMSIGGFGEFGFGGSGPGWDGPKVERFTAFPEALARMQAWEASALERYYDHGQKTGGPFFNSLGRLMADIAHHMDRITKSGSDAVFEEFHAGLKEWRALYEGTDIVSPEELAHTLTQDPLAGMNAGRGRKPWENWREAARRYGLHPARPAIGEYLQLIR